MARALYGGDLSLLGSGTSTLHIGPGDARHAHDPTSGSRSTTSPEARMLVLTVLRWCS